MAYILKLRHSYFSLFLQITEKFLKKFPKGLAHNLAYNWSRVWDIQKRMYAVTDRKQTSSGIPSYST